VRIKDVDWEYRQSLVWDGKGQKDRVTMLYTHTVHQGGKGVRSPFDLV
jgi:hypothetical protein